MQVVIDIPEETYKTISEWKEPNPKYAAEYMLYGFVKNGKQIEQEPCGDAISRQEVIDLLHGETEETYITSNGRITYRIAEINVDDLMNIPSATPQQKVGRWIDNSRDGYTQYYCSCCCDSKSETSKKSNYCPNCGCRMMGVEE